MIGQPKALITGASGFTGTHLEHKLRLNGYRVFGLVHDLAEAGEDRYCIDLCNKQGVAELVNELQVDVVVHLAAVSFVAHENIEDMYSANILGTHNLLNALAHCEKRPASVILASSANVYGNSNVECLKEESALAPANDYAVSKMAMEAMAALWKSQLPIVITRPFNYSGVGQSERFLLPKIVDHFARAETMIMLGNIDVYRDFSDIRMVVSAYSQLIEQGVTTGIFNICSGTLYSLSEILQLMGAIAGYEIEVDVNPAFVRKNEIRYLRGSNAQLIERIGPLECYSMEDTLRWMYQNKINS